MRRSTGLAASLLLPLALLTACGDTDEPASSTAPSSSPPSASTSASPSPSPAAASSSAAPSSAAADDAAVIEVTVQGDDITPNGDRVEVAVGQPIELDITADAPGEVHVHSSPEQEFEYDAGSSTVTIEPITRPGIVDVESHTLEKTIVQLQVQ